MAGRGTPDLTWQTMDTAPRDGSWFLAWGDNDPTGGENYAIVSCPYPGKSWVVPHDGEMWGWSDFVPRYWMPLPPVPGDPDA